MDDLDMSAYKHGLLSTCLCVREGRPYNGLAAVCHTIKHAKYTTPSTLYLTTELYYNTPLLLQLPAPTSTHKYHFCRHIQLPIIVLKWQHEHRMAVLASYNKDGHFLLTVSI